MRYTMEELMPVVVRLADRYTGRESSSVPYETARMLVKAVVYCLEEAEAEGNRPASGQAVSPGILYERGKELVLRKTGLAKELYEKLAVDFDDYGCFNYRQTVINGMPQFFLKYDAIYNPQDHLLTLDYPTLHRRGKECGVDLIYRYLKNIRIEALFLEKFDGSAVRSLLGRLQPDYSSLYLDNICAPVLTNAVGCVIADKPVRELKLTDQDCRNIQVFFEGCNTQQIAEKAACIIRCLTYGLQDEEAVSYFEGYGREFAVLASEAIRNKTLHVLFATAGDADATVVF